MTSKIEQLKDVMKLLRDPVKGCPWDIEQNFTSIASCTIEEAYEVLDAIQQNDMAALEEELGDLLLQVVFHAQMASELGLFDFESVTNSIINKLITRHPHVFGDAKISTAAQQTESWEQLKQQERNEKITSSASASQLDGVAMALPALLRASKLQKRAAKVGFDWPDLTGVYAKINEELQEVTQAVHTGSNIKEELGDLLFAVVNLARKLDIDPEEALRDGNEKFARRFRYIENNITKNGSKLQEASLEEMDVLWNEAKRQEVQD